MAWVITRNIQALRDQLNEYFPTRDHSSDGYIGDYLHSLEDSGHNPDDTDKHNAEWDGDSDTKQEVRAGDFDSDLNDPEVSMEDVLQHLLRLAKSDSNFPLRYLIFNRRIFRKTNNWSQEVYTGASAHTEHLHASGDYKDSADENYYDYKLEELVMPTANEIADAVQAKLRNSYDDLSDSERNRLTSVIDTKLAVRFKALGDVLASIATKVDIDPSEIQAIKTALAVPTAQDNAKAVVASLGGVPTANLAQALKTALSPSQVAELKAAL